MSAALKQNNDNTALEALQTAILHTEIIKESSQKSFNLEVIRKYITYSTLYNLHL